MGLDEIRKTLFKAASLRIPRFEERDSTGTKIDKLEDYLLKMAMMRGDLEEARLYAQQALRDLGVQWQDISRDAYDLHLPKGKKVPSQEDIRQAKRAIGPDERAIDDGMQEARWLIARLTEQIQRLSHMGDDQVASRIYTLMAGS